jgi:hypothetical protein
VLAFRVSVGIGNVVFMVFIGEWGRRLNMEGNIDGNRDGRFYV